MNDERYDPLWYNAEASDPFTEMGTGRHRAGAVYAEPVEPAVPPWDQPAVPPWDQPAVPPWDPAEELAYLLQEARSDEYAAPTVPPPREETSVTAPPAGSPMGNLQEITAELPPLRSAPRAHRKPPRPRPDAVRVASYAIAAMA